MSGLCGKSGRGGLFGSPDDFGDNGAVVRAEVWADGAVAAVEGAVGGGAEEDVVDGDGDEGVLVHPGGRGAVAVAGVGPSGLEDGAHRVAPAGGVEVAEEEDGAGGGAGDAGDFHEEGVALGGPEGGGGGDGVCAEEGEFAEGAGDFGDEEGESHLAAGVDAVFEDGEFGVEGEAEISLDDVVDGVGVGGEEGLEGDGPDGVDFGQEDEVGIGLADPGEGVVMAAVGAEDVEGGDAE